MTFMQSALRQMHEERFDRPEDERDDFEREDNPLAGSSRPSESADEPAREEPTGWDDPNHPDAHLMNHASREASSRKDARGNSKNENFRATNSFIEKPKAHVAAGPGYQGDPTDELLFLQYRDGNELAFISIYERYKASIYAYCAHVLFGAGLSRETVEDTFQDVFFRLIQYRHTFTGGDFKPWILTVTRHSCISAKKKFWRDHEMTDRSKESTDESETSGELRNAMSFNEDPLELMTKAEQTGLLLAAIAKLPEEFREALVLNEYEEMSYEEIAQVLGVTMSTVRIRIYRAKAKLRKMLMPVLGDPGPIESGEPGTQS